MIKSRIYVNTIKSRIYVNTIKSKICTKKIKYLLAQVWTPVGSYEGVILIKHLVLRKERSLADIS